MGTVKAGFDTDKDGWGPIGGYGVGTRLLTSSDAPYLDCAYKLQEYAGQPRGKRSEGTATWPGRKQVYRRYDADGRMAGDVLTTESDRQAGEPLLLPVMRGGKRLALAAALPDVRAFAAQQIGRLPAHLRALAAADPYPVEVAPALRALARAVDEQRT